LPAVVGGDLGRAVDLMIDEANRCYYELGLRGMGEMIPAHWYPNDLQVVRLWQALADLGMYVAFQYSRIEHGSPLQRPIRK